MAEYSPITAKHGWHAGDDNPADWIVKTAGVAIDITGFAIEWIMRSDEESADNILRYTTADTEMAIPVGTDGVVTLDVPDTGTDGKLPREYYYWLRRTDAGSEKILAQGPVVLQAGPR